MRIEERDKMLLIDLFKRKVLTVKQVQRLRFGDTRSGYRIACRRLKHLEDVGLVWSFWAGYKSTCVKHYSLTRVGYRFAAESLGLEGPVKEIRKERTLHNVEHLVGTNEIGIRLATARPEYRLLDFEVEAMYSWQEGKETLAYRPDAYGHYVHQESMRFLLEYDRMFMSPNTFSAKVSRIERMYMSNAYQRWFSVFPFVLVVTKTPKRVVALAEAIKAVKKTDVTFMICDEVEFMKDPLGPIWTVPGPSKRYSILQARGG